MSCLGNVIWFIFGGLINFVVWSFFGVLLCLTIIGIPLGRQCFKMARLSAAPFGKEVIVSPRGSSLFLNILWILLAGVPIAAIFFMSGVVLCVTIIGIPFGIQQFKLMLLALFPFGSVVRPSISYYSNVMIY